MKKRRRAYAAILARYADSFTLEPTRGGHYKATVIVGGLKRSLFMAGSPSDIRNARNTEAEIKRTCRQLREASLNGACDQSEKRD